MSTLSSDVRTLSSEAYVYLYPMVLMEVTRQQSISGDPGVNVGFGASNEFHHLRAFPTAEFRSVVRPNFDTLYSSAWLDLTEGPVHIHAADSGDRYYMLPMLDMWTDVFANPGKRTTGTGELDILVTGPGYTGATPEGATVISAPTPYVWVVGRTQTGVPQMVGIRGPSAGHCACSQARDVPPRLIWCRHTTRGVSFDTAAG